MISKMYKIELHNVTKVFSEGVNVNTHRNMWSSIKLLAKQTTNLVTRETANINATPNQVMDHIKNKWSHGRLRTLREANFNESEKLYALRESQGMIDSQEHRDHVDSKYSHFRSDYKPELCVIRDATNGNLPAIFEKLPGHYAAKFKLPEGDIIFAITFTSKKPAFNVADGDGDTYTYTSQVFSNKDLSGNSANQNVVPHIILAENNTLIFEQNAKTIAFNNDPENRHGMYKLIMKPLLVASDRAESKLTVFGETDFEGKKTETHYKVVLHHLGRNSVNNEPQVTTYVIDPF